jgi:DNA-binding XRE family transcriptional regulator
MKSVIRQHRAKQGWTQTELADKVNVSKTTIVSWEQKNTIPKVHDLITLSVQLEVSLEELLQDYNKE